MKLPQLDQSFVQKTNMIAELDRVMLSNDLPVYNLKADDIGTVVLIHGNGEGYEVEFVALNGETLAVASIYTSQFRPAMSREISHARAVG